MVQMTPGGNSPHSADELARLLTDAALADPRLLQHPRMFRVRELHGLPPGLQTVGGLRPVGDGRPRSTQIESVPLPSGSDTDEYLEQLVSIAVSSAQQAEEALQSAGNSQRSNRRTIMAAAGIGALGVLVGIIGIADKRLIDRADARLTRVTTEMRALADMQQQTSGQLAQLRTQAAAQPVDVGSTPRGIDSPTPVGAPVPVVGQDPEAHPEAPDQTAVNAVSNVETATSAAAPTPPTASAPAAALPTQPYNLHADAPVGQSPWTADAEMPSSEGAPAPSVAPPPSVGSTPVPKFPTQPYGRHPIVLVGLAASADDGSAPPVPPPFADVPAPPGAAPRVARPATPVRRTATWHGRPPSANPVRDVRNFVVAVGYRVRGLFVR
jgi:hypothetical protein